MVSKKKIFEDVSKGKIRKGKRAKKGIKKEKLDRLDKW